MSIPGCHASNRARTMGEPDALIPELWLCRNNQQSAS